MSENPVESRGSDGSPGDAVVNWDRIIYKNVRTLDNQGMGKVIAVPNDEDTIIISSQSGGEQYKIPRSCVSGFNGAEVLLDETAYKISLSYRADNVSAYEARPSDIITKEHQQPLESAQSTQLEEEEEATTTVPLIEERLNVSKRTSTTQYTITKEPVTEKKTIEVPVTREELIVEKRPAKDSTSSSAQGPVKSKTEIKVPLMREEVEVTKKPFVKEEVVVKKKPVTETRTVSDTVTSERINMSGTATVRQGIMETQE
jgi:uncharacterized protein (TIGR02271 family)